MRDASSDSWDTTLSRDQPAPRCDARTSPQLIRLMSCDRITPSSRHVLAPVTRVTIGRAATMCVQRTDRELWLGVTDRRMSSRHVELCREDEGWVLRDLGSKNGTWLDGQPMRERPVGDGDVIEAGQTFFLFRDRVALSPGEPLDVDASGLVPPLPGLATFNPGLARALAQLPRIAAAPVHVLILGPTGSGKEVIARALHSLSGRRGAFVPVNCGALPDELVEAELFGSLRGSFSGATDNRLGFLRAAEGGTLFLDEIGDLHLQSQPALLRALQEREVVPVGASRPIPVDIQVISATHRDLPAMVAAKAFREDLLSRLLGFTLTLPPLAGRREDLGLLLASIVARIAPHGDATFTPEAMRRLLLHAWPLNIRELENCMISAIALAAGRPIDVEVLPDRVCARPPPPRRSPADERVRDRLIALLEQHAGNISQVARSTGTTRMQIHRRAKRFGIDLQSYRRGE